MPDGSVPAFTPATTLSTAELALAGHPDAEVIALCTGYIEREMRWEALADENLSLPPCPAMLQLQGELTAIGERVVQLGCKTLDGLRAVAGVLHDRETLEEAEGSAQARLRGLIVRSLLAGVAAGPDLLGTTALTPISDDAPLGQAVVSMLAARWHELDRTWDRLELAGGDAAATPEMDAIEAEMSGLCERILDLGCRNLRDVQAVAGMLATGIAVMDEAISPFERLKPMMIRALIGLVPAIGDDAALIEACGQFSTLQERINELFETQGTDGLTDEERDAAQLPFETAQKPILDRILDLPPPSTLAGARAVAKALVLWDSEAFTETGCTHDYLGQVLLRGLTEQAATPEPVSLDAELIATVGEFCRQADRYDACDFGARPGSRREKRATAEQKREQEAMYVIAGRMAGMVATTPGGLAARAMAIGRNDPTFAFAYDSSEGAAGSLLAPLLRDGAALAAGAPPPNPDAALLALEPEYLRLRAAYDKANDEDVPWEKVEYSGEAFDDLCGRIVDMPPAVTQRGRALQAIAALHQFHYMQGAGQGVEPTGAEGVVWRMLVGLVGDAYPIPGANRTGADPVEADAPLQALQQEYEELQAALDARPKRGRTATQRKLTELIGKVAAMPTARTASGLAFQAAVKNLTATAKASKPRATRVAA